MNHPGQVYFNAESYCEPGRRYAQAYLDLEAAAGEEN
jgi:hypothetical protein